MRLTQGAFSFLPDLTDEEIRQQIEYCLQQGWSLNVEYTDEPHPRNTYWEMWCQPMFDVRDAAAIMLELNDCRRAFPRHYIKINAFDSAPGRETVALSFIVNRPPAEPGFSLVRTGGGRTQPALHNSQLRRGTARRPTLRGLSRSGRLGKWKPEGRRRRKLTSMPSCASRTSVRC